MKLAVSAYSYANSKISDIERIHRAAETGFEGIEFVELLEDQEITHEEKLAYAKSLRREAEACGLAVPAYAIGAKMYHGDRAADLAEIERLKREVEVAAALGAPLMRHDIINTEVVNVGNTIKVLNKALNKEMTFQIVGSAEANPREQRISNESPVGAGLLGHKLGEVVTINTPGGASDFEILEISK